ncbi:MAG: hypothetical protein JW963_00345 [Anaerolineales bacterium]|nr:hypothetical protein [Anaerolineales bacterium]
MDIFRKRLPERKDVFIVSSVILFAVFSWSIRGFFFVLPSITMRYAFVEVFAIFSYMMAFAFLESSLILVGLLILSFFLPMSWLRDGFSYKGFIIVFIGSIAFIRYQAILGYELPDKEFFFLWIGILILTIVTLSLLFHFVYQLQVSLVSFVERFTVFSFLYIPLGLLGLIVVIVRNLFGG